MLHVGVMDIVALSVQAYLNLQPLLLLMLSRLRYAILMLVVGTPVPSSTMVQSFAGGIMHIYRLAHQAFLPQM